MSLKQISLDEWGARYDELVARGMEEPWYGGPLKRHTEDGDLRLLKLDFDNSPASLDLWNFLLTEEDRLRDARAEGKKIVGTMKDLGTVPVMAYSLPDVVAFYPDGAWWIPCVMEQSAGLLKIADSLGIDESFCPVRAMLGAFVSGAHFPEPDLLICSVGAVCDDFSAIAQRLNGLGRPILWWEIPYRGMTREEGVGLREFVESELGRVRGVLEDLSGEKLTDEKLSDGIRFSNRIRSVLKDLRREVFTAKVCPLPALELLIAEMLAIHFCSDREESLRVLSNLLGEVRKRTDTGAGFLGEDAVRVFWVNPVADIQVMNLLEKSGIRICGTDYMFTHALDRIPENVPPMEALASMALADPMVGSAIERAGRICRDAVEFGSEAVVISRIPGASHCATEGEIIGNVVSAELGIPVIELEVPPVSDAVSATLRTRLEALVETVKNGKRI